MTVRWAPALPPWAVAILVVALMALLVHGSGVLIRKRVPRRWITALGLLRFVIIAVFAVCLLQPAVSFERTIQEQPPVLVLLDASKSMGSKSTGASTGNRLAESLHWLESHGLRRQLASRENVHWFGFDAHARPLNEAGLAALETEGAATHFADSLTEAWEHYRQQRTHGLPLVSGGRVLLVSDGNDSETRDAAEVAQSLGLAIDTLAPVPAAAGAAQPRVSVVQVQAPRRVLLGAESRFAITLRQENLAGQALQLQLQEGGRVVATQPFTFTAGEQEKTVPVSFRPEDAGLKQYSIAIEGAPAGTIAETDLSRFSVQVAGARNEVLLLEDTWRWDFKFLRRIFEDDPSFTLTSFLSRGGNAFVQLAEPDRRTQVNGFPQSRAELGGFDTIVIGSADPRRWPRGLAASLRPLVEKEGKSLIVIAGPNLRAWLDEPGMAELLPVELSPESVTPAAGPVAVRVTPEGLASPFFAAPGPGPAAFWSSLPPMDQIYPALRKKPAATALVEAAQLANAYGNVIVMAEHTAGRGRVLFIATDTLWKWQMLAPAAEGPTPYQVFWQQALRAFAPIRQSTGHVNLYLSQERSRYTSGQTVTLRAEVQSARALPKARVQGQVTLPDGKQLPLAFAPSAAEAGLHSARFDTSISGQYKVAASVAVEDKTAADSLIVFDVEEGAGEVAGQEINTANLARLARETGGHVIDRSDPASWRDLVSAARVPVTHLQTVDLWNGSTLLILLSLLLGVDWLLRLLRGFA